MSTQLRDMFDAAAESELPNSIAERAIGAARQRRRQRYVVGGAVVAIAAVVLGVVVAVNDVRMDTEPKPTDVAAIPDRLPKADGLPVADYAEMTAASAAYVSQGELVIVDSATGEPARAREGAQDQPPNADWFSLPLADVFLSPNGRWAVVSLDVTQGREKLEGTRLLKMDTGEWFVLEGVTLADEGVMWPQQAVVSWTPDSTAFICACIVDPQPVPSVAKVSVGDDTGGGAWQVEELSGGSGLQVTAGAGGFATQFEAQGGPWLVNGDIDTKLPAASMLALSAEDRGRFIAVNGGRIEIASYGGSGDALEVTQEVQRTYSTSGIRPTYLQAASSGWIMGWQSPEESAVPKQPITTYTVSAQGLQYYLANFPSGTESLSFAGDLIPIPSGLEGLPQSLPTPDGLPTLLSGDSMNASAAYVVDGQLVVIEAITGEGYLVDLAVGNDLQGPALVGEDAEVHLSPDGRYVLLTRGQGAGSSSDGDTVWLVDLHRGLARKQDLQLVASAPSATTPPPRIAWAPDGEHFALVSANSLGGPDIVQRVAMDEIDEHLNLNGGAIVSVSSPTQIVWGQSGLLGQFDELDGDWAWFDEEGVTDLKPEDPQELSPLVRTSKMPPDRILLSPHSGEYIEWSDIGLIEAFYGDTALTLDVGQHWFAGSWVDAGPIVVLEDRGFIDSDGREVSYFETDGTGGSVAGLFPISTLPPGTVAASFAADVLDAEPVDS